MLFVDISSPDKPKFTPLLYVLYAGRVHAVEAISDNRDYYLHAEKAGGGWRPIGYWVSRTKCVQVTNN